MLLNVDSDTCLFNVLCGKRGLQKTLLQHGEI